MSHGETGFTATTPAEWTSAILALAGDERLRQRLGETARLGFAAHHTRSAVQQRLLGCWRALVSGQ